MEGLSNETLEAEITALWAQISAATYRFLKLLARYDREQGWAQHGLADCAQWLNWQCGVGPVAAREKLRVAHALEDLPVISDAFARGQLSYSKVRALTRVARPEIEDDLLNIARHGTAAHVERLVRHYRRCQRLEAAREAFAQHRERTVNYWFDDDGSLVLHARLAPEVGAVLKKALELAAEQVFAAANVSAETSADAAAGSIPDAPAESSAARRADALAALAEHYLAAAETDDEHRRRSNAERYQVIVHVETDAAEAQIEDGPPIAEETARRIACDASVRVMTHDAAGNPLDVGRRTRAISPAMRRALYKRDRGCRFPGCTHTRHTQGHHIRHWADGGETKLSNLVTLCGIHHRLIHEGGFEVRYTDDGLFVFSDPNGRRIPEAGRLEQCFSGNISAADSLAAAHTRAGVRIDSATIRSRWRGESLDYSQAIEAMMQNDR